MKPEQPRMQYYEVHDLRQPPSQTYVRLLLGFDQNILFQQALGLTGIPADKLELRPTGRFQKACTSCGKS